MTNPQLIQNPHLVRVLLCYNTSMNVKKLLSNLVLSVPLAILLAAGVTFAAWATSTWHGTNSWIANGSVINAQKVAENFEYLYANLGGDNEVSEMGIHATWSQSLLNSTFTNITSMTEVNNDFSTSTFSGGNFTVGSGEDGWYILSGDASAPNASDELQLKIRVNSITIASQSSKTTTGAPVVSASGSYKLSVGDVVYLHVRQISGATKTITGRFSVTKIAGESGGGGGGGGGTSLWSQNGSSIYYNGGNVGIGTANPATNLHILGDFHIARDPTIVPGAMYANISDEPADYDEEFVISMWDGEWGGDGPRGDDRSSIFIGPNSLTGGVGRVEFSAGKFHFDTGNVGIGVENPGEKLDVAGNVRATAFLYSSDRRLKDNIRPLANALGNILKLRPANFVWKKDKSNDVGLIAQEVEEILPTVVHTDAGGFKTVDYAKLTTYLIGAMQEQQKQIDALKAQCVAY